MPHNSTPLKRGSPLSPYEYPPAPDAGQRYVDRNGTHWLVRSRAHGTDGYFAVLLAYGPTPNDLPNTAILGPSEFISFVRDNALTLCPAISDSLDCRLPPT
jgi:hypothetical protein